ncbi:MAG: 26 kDa periplasmic immunogenic protein precursor [Parcubacteria group bacterium ADurb.Bin159]|nr:MAG: 26 kDa periplasmic immunogenic protein precursor [Parcubacteria group bacterium ADurb.Bin159]
MEKEKKATFNIFIFILSAFLVVLIVLGVVIIQNKIEERKYIGRENESRNTITVFGTGEVYAKPDLAITNFSVITDEKTVDKAMSKNTEKMNAVIEAIKNKGVDGKDMKTTNFNINPRYEWYENGRRVLVGYEITQSLETKIRDMEKIGEIIETATNAGANQIGDLQFTIDKEEELQKQARKEAIKEAKAKAEELASDLGIKLVKISGFSESSGTPVYPIYSGLLKADQASGMGGAVPQIETGENKIEVTVDITYEIL